MSKYAIVPIENVCKIKQTYLIANPSTWQLEKGDTIYGGLEDQNFTNDQIVEIQNLGGQIFENAYDFLDWQQS